MTILVEPDDSVARLLLSALGQATTVVPSLDMARDHLSNVPDEDVVVIGPNVDPTSSMRLATDYRVTRPALGVILVRRRVETSLLAEGLRAGIRDVVEDRDLAGVNRAVQRAKDLAKEMRLLGEAGDGAGPDTRRGHVITVFSAKGGCGKTTMSTNLGALLASEYGKSVCLVDLDLEFGDVAISLQLVPTHSIAEAVAMGTSLDSEGLDDLLTTHSSGLKVLSAPVGPDARQSIKPELVDRIISLLVQEFDVVIIDTPPSFDDTVLATFDRTDLLILLTTLDVPAIKNLKIALETLSLLNFSSDKIRVVVNRSDSRVGIGIEDVEKAIKTPVSGRIPSSRDVPAMANRGLTIATENPRHPVSQSLVSFIKSAIEAVSAEPDGPEQQRRPLFRSRKG